MIDHNYLINATPLTQEQRDALFDQIMITYKAYDALQRSHREFNKLIAKIHDARIGQ